MCKYLGSISSKTKVLLALPLRTVKQWGLAVCTNEISTVLKSRMEISPKRKQCKNRAKQMLRKKRFAFEPTYLAFTLDKDETSQCKRSFGGGDRHLEPSTTCQNSESSYSFFRNVQFCLQILCSATKSNSWGRKPLGNILGKLLGISAWLKNGFISLVVSTAWFLLICIKKPFVFSLWVLF